METMETTLVRTVGYISKYKMIRSRYDHALFWVKGEIEKAETSTEAETTARRQKLSECKENLEKLIKSADDDYARARQIFNEKNLGTLWEAAIVLSECGAS